MNSEGGSDFWNHHIKLLQKKYETYNETSPCDSHRTKTKQSIETVPESSNIGQSKQKLNQLLHKYVPRTNIQCD